MDIAGLDDLTEYLGELKEYANDLSEYAHRPKRTNIYRRTQSALKDGVPQPKPHSPFASLPHHTYRVIYSDPPWQVYSVDHYHTMTAAQMATTFPVKDLNDKRGTAHFMWVVSSLLPDAINLLTAWGYTYRTIAFCWAKTKGTTKDGTPKLFMGNGRTTRGSVEICLEAHSGNNPPMAAMKDVLQMVVSPLGEHSAKPAEVRQRITELYPDLPRLELFARNQFKDWDVFGNQVTKGVPQPSNAQPAGLINVAPPNASRSWWENKTIITTKEAAEIIGVSPHRIIDFIKEGRLDARKVGGAAQGGHWDISKRSALEFNKEERSTGRPSKGNEPKKRMTR